MSRSNKDARRRSNATGQSYMQALSQNTLPPRGYSDPSKRDPVADQVGLEFVVFYQLVDEFNGQFTRPGTTLGLDSVSVRDGYVVLVPAQEYSEQVVTRLLPSYDHESGNHYGVAGLRACRRGDEWELRVRNTDAKIHIPAERFPEGILKGEWNSVPDRLELIWKNHKHYLCDEEIERWWFNPRGIHDGNPLLASTLLRRPAIVQRLNSVGTCWVDIYHHTYSDVMLEWCCGPSKEVVSQWISEESPLERWLDWPPPISVDDEMHNRRHLLPLKLMRHECGEARLQWTGEPHRGHILSLVDAYKEDLS